MVNGTDTGPQLAPGATTFVTFFARFDASVRDAHAPTFEVDVKLGPHVFSSDPAAVRLGTSLFSIDVAAPDLVYTLQELAITGSSGSDSVYALTPYVTNLGGGVADNVCLELAGNGVADKLPLGEIAPGATAGGDTSFVFTADPSDIGTLTFSLTIENEPVIGTRSETRTIDFSPPSAPSSPDAYVTSEEGVSIEWTPISSPPADHWGTYVYRRKASEPASAFVRLNTAEPTEIGHFVDATAERNTTYVYGVTSVDDSGNESARVDAPQQTMTVPVHTGWPRRMDRKGAPSAVRALDYLGGDSDSLEIFALGDQLYCWKADGSPCFSYGGNRPELTAHAIAYATDPDTTYNFFHGRYWPAMVIANLDGDSSADEVILTSMVGIVTVLDYDSGGDSLEVRWEHDFSEGRPFAAAYAAPSVADVTGDGKLEVLVNSARQRLYIFDRNGAAVNTMSSTDSTNCATAIAGGSFDADACECYAYGAYNSWTTPVVIEGSGGARKILIARADGRLTALDENCDHLWTYNTSTGDVLSTPVVGNVSAGGTANDIVFVVGGDGNDHEVHVITEGDSLLKKWDVADFDFGEDKYVQPPALADLTGDGRPEVLVGRNRPSGNSTSATQRAQRVYVLDPDASGAQTCELVLGLPSRGVMHNDVWSQPTIVEWDGDFRIFAGSSAFGVMSWLWEGTGSSDCDAGDSQWAIHVSERVMGTPWVGDMDDDGKFNLVAADVGGRVWVWDLDESYAASKIEWGEHGHDRHNTFTYGASVARAAGSGPRLDVQLFQNAPNPFNPLTSIGYALSEAGHVRLSIFDPGGRLVRTLVDEVNAAGDHTVVWDATDGAGHDVSSGVYFYTIAVEEQVTSRKLLILR